MIKPSETWYMTSSYLGRKKDISQKTTYQRMSQFGNAMKHTMKTRQKIPEIMPMAVLRNYKITR